MFSVVPGTSTYGDCGLKIADNMGTIESRAFLTFGHVNIKRIMEDLDNDPFDDDPRLKYPADTAIGRMILKAENRADLEDKFRTLFARGDIKDEYETKISEDFDAEGRAWVRIGPLA